MKKLKLNQLISFLVLSVATFTIHANNAAVQLKKLAGDIDTVKANFTQTLVKPNGERIEQSSGNMAVKRPGLLYWKINKPSRQLIVVNKEKFYHYDVELEQVVIKPTENSLERTPAVLFGDDLDSLDELFSIAISSQETDEAQQKFILIPKGSDSLIQQIEIVFAYNKLRSMHLLDHLEQITIMDFSKVMQNTSVANSLFEFEIPKDVDVIEETF